MVKYSSQDLADMAKRVEKAKSQGDSRYLEFIMAVALRCGLAPDQVMKMSAHMAKKAA